MASKKKKITFKYVIPENLRDCWSNGVWGGVTPRGEINMHFFNERAALPNSEAYEIDEDGKLKTPPEIDKGGDIVRMIQASITIDVTTAIKIKNWLDDRIKYIESHDDKEKDGNEGKNDES